MSNAPETHAAPHIVLDVEDADQLRAAARAVQDASRAAELAAAKAKVAVGEALEAQIACLRALATKYPTLDPDQPWQLAGRVLRLPQ